MIESMIIAGIGGFFGTCGRYLTGVAAKRMFSGSFPAGTFIVNIVGCFLIGIFFGLWGRHEMDAAVKALLITGFCGGFTTFSSFSHDQLKLLREGKYLTWGLYLVLTVVLGLAAVYAGMACI
ncbi:MAG: fluoride efflux transporter CrcB [Bacteroides sp.]|nr:fluoride efflux transporter CrcB [Bacteroides sp.]MCM1456962.1 fluoride efflux transporter CrcB [Lachnoclostridium sp.]